MNPSLYYTLRSQINGNYLVAYPQQDDAAGYLLVFQQDFDALSYLNTHSPSQVGSDRFAVESLPGSQLKAVLQRWQLRGIGLVQDPLLPEIEFLSL